MKLMLNRHDWKQVIDEKCGNREGFRPFFTSLLQTVTGDYVSHESALKNTLAQCKDTEAELKSEQSQIKNTNLLYSRNFSILTEALKSVFEFIILENHSLQLNKLFGLGDIQEAKNGFVHNFITFYVNQRLSSTLARADVVQFVGTVIGEQSGESDSLEFLQIMSEFSQDNDNFSNFCSNNLYRTLNLDNPTVDTLQWNPSAGDQMTPQDGIKEFASSALQFRTHASKLLLDEYVKGCADSWRKLTSLSERRHSSSLKEDEISPEPVNKEANGSTTPKTHNFPVLKDIEKRALRLSSSLSSLFIGGEILRADFLTALLEYSSKRKHEKKEKKEYISKSLYELASETHRLLMAELEPGGQSLLRNEIDERRCALCSLQDKHPVGGRLIHMRKHEWIHDNCAYWSEGITEWQFKGGLEVYQAIKKAKSSNCAECGQSGASIAGHIDPNKKMHLICALKSKAVFSFSATERKVYHLEAWVKHSLSTYQKHYKNCNPLFFLFCASMELITTFRLSKRLFIVKRYVKGVMSESIKSDYVTDLGTSIRELHLKHKNDALAEGRNLRPLISRIGSLFVLNLADAAALPDLQKTGQLLSKVRNQFMLGLRRDKLAAMDDYCEGKKEILSIMIHRWLVARLVPVAPAAAHDAPEPTFELYALESDLSKASGIFTIQVAQVPCSVFMERVRKFYDQETSGFNLSDLQFRLVDPSHHIDVLFRKMGLCYGEMRAYLCTALKSSLERLRQSQFNFKNYADYQHIFYQSGLEQHILLDIGEKHSIYDRLKLIWQINSDLESSRDFQRDSRYIQEKQLLGCRSKLNPKSRSFNKGSPFQQHNNDNHRFAEKLILQLANQKPAKNSSEVPQTSALQLKRKVNPLHKNTEKTSTVLKKGYQAYKPLNTMVAPSKIHKYGKLSVNRSLRWQVFPER